ncbi:MAG: hypothetical protein Q8O48_05180, partial [Anaerolineales bacterium]|nr:hypothetical protein [Anaerolineales bacterium]
RTGARRKCRYATKEQDWLLCGMNVALRFFRFNSDFFFAVGLLRMTLRKVSNQIKKDKSCSQ